MTVVAPYALSYAQRVPYLSIAEFKAAPTGLDLANLVEGGTQQAQDQALAELIDRASATADNFCFGASGTLCASLNTETDQVRADRDGFWRIHPRYWPILAVASFSVGPTPGDLESVPLSSANCWIEESEFVITQGAISSVTSQGPLQFGRGGLPGYRQFAQWSYVNGWPNLFLASPAIQGATSLVSTVVPQGVFAGTQLNVWDPAANGSDEVVTVANTYVAGSTTIPLTAPTQFAHAAGINVSNLPQSVKQAIIVLVTSAVRLRGEVGFTLGPEGEPTMDKGAESFETEDEARAYDLLDPFRCVVR